MLNRRPVFIIAYARGGSNILLNLLRSHPELCSPRGETQEVFKGKSNEPLGVRVGKIANYLPILLREGKDVFSMDLWKERGLSNFSKSKIDKILYKDKLKALEPSQNLYKTENVKYRQEEIADARLLCKNLNGLIFLTSDLSEMYPDATFIGLVRNGLAVVEGHMRRGLSLERFSRSYEIGCQQMILDSKRFPNYHIYKYEDIMNNPDDMLREIYDKIDLDLSAIEKVRLETKKVIGQDGTHSYTHQSKEKKLIWYSREEYFEHFIPNVNENQINRLKEEQKSRISEICQKSLEYFDYN